MDRIELINESGEIEVFEVVDTFGMDDMNYAVLMVADTEEPEVLLLRIENDNDEMILVSIEDEEEFNDAIAIYEELKQETIQ